MKILQPFLKSAVDFFPYKKLKYEKITEYINLRTYFKKELVQS